MLSLPTSFCPRLGCATSPQGHASCGISYLAVHLREPLAPSDQLFLYVAAT